MATYSKNYFAFKAVLQPALIQALKTLFEEKHLYQSIELRPDTLSSAIEEAFKEGIEREQKLQSLEFEVGHRSKFSSKEEITRQVIAKEACDFLSTALLSEPMNREHYKVEINVETIRTYCNSPLCKAIQPHNIVGKPNFFTQHYFDSNNNAQQTFTFTFLCQNCKVEHVNYLVRRDGRKIMLSGRSPIEHIEIPKYVPKAISKFYRGAVIAFNSGAILPALFMLRTTIEQHMRNAIDAGNTRISGEDLVAAYVKQLDPDFNSRFPSLKPIYETLSDAIHAAKDDDPKLFEEEMKKMLYHLEAKELFERMR